MGVLPRAFTARSTPLMRDGWTPLDGSAAARPSGSTEIWHGNDPLSLSAGVPLLRVRGIWTSEHCAHVGRGLRERRRASFRAGARLAGRKNIVRVRVGVVLKHGTRKECDVRAVLYYTTRAPPLSTVSRMRSPASTSLNWKCAYQYICASLAAKGWRTRGVARKHVR